MNGFTEGVTRMRPLLIAHRCGPGVYPEQSMASARHALSLGADMVEMDVRYTRDAVPVICHDADTARVFGVGGRCEDMTLAEFIALRHAADGRYGAHSLDDVLRSEIRPLLLHCKFSGEALRDLAERVRAAGAQEACVVGVARTGDVEVVKAACPGIRVLAFMPELAQLDGFLHSCAEFVRLWEEWVDDERVRTVHGAGKRVWIMAGGQAEGEVGYTTEASMRRWMRLGVDGILVNDVAWAMRIMRPGEAASRRGID